MAMRSAAKSLLERLKTAPHRFDPFEALRHLDHLQRGTGRPRVRGTITNRHVAVPLARTSQEGDDDGAIDVAFVALAGPLGPLPPNYTEAALLARKRRSPSLAAFFDIFVQRLAELFVRAAEKYRLPARVARAAADGAQAGSDVIAASMFALIGFALPALRGRLSFPDSELLPYAGLLGNRTRSAAGLAVMLTDFLRVPVSIEPFRGRWVAVSPSEQTKLDSVGAQYSRLGVDAIAGARLFDVQGAFRIVVGPLDYPDFLSFSPDGARMRRLVDAARLYAGPHLSFDVQLVLAKQAIPECQLAGTKAMLGWNTWVRMLPATHDSGSAIHSVER
jgi:type VI secretion system protein ImpH